MSRRCEHRDREERRCELDAVFELLDPDGDTRGAYCRTHGRRIVEEYDEVLGELWTLRTLEVAA